MKSEDLRELLLSIAEEDAIISNIYSFFIINKGYSIQDIEKIIFYGISIGWFCIVNVETDDILDVAIDWRVDNISQEIVFCNMEVAIEQLFNGTKEIPEEFKIFIIW